MSDAHLLSPAGDRRELFRVRYLWLEHVAVVSHVRV